MSVSLVVALKRYWHFVRLYLLAAILMMSFSARFCCYLLNCSCFSADFDRLLMMMMLIFGCLCLLILFARGYRLIYLKTFVVDLLALILSPSFVVVVVVELNLLLLRMACEMMMCSMMANID